MTRPEPPPAGDGWDHWLPYAVTAVGLGIGLFVLLFEPLPWPTLNDFLGWSILGVAFGSVYYLVGRHGGPGERGPDF